LDRIWAGPDGAVSGIRVHRTPLARRASDHLPVRAQIRWHAPLPGAPRDHAKVGTTG
jgi:endonuclease/exonuclease/phosphatase family metal-dependent hydrolase